MVLQFGSALVQVFQRCAGQFKLAARLQRDIRAVAGHADDVVRLLHRLPAKGLQACKQR